MFGRFASFDSSYSTDPLAPRLFFLPPFVIHASLFILSLHASFYLHFSQLQAHL